MFIKSAIGSALLSLAVLAATPVFAADSDPSIHQVYQAAEAGRFSDAQAMMDKVLRDHPNSAKAHYIEADLLAKQNRLREAQTELNSAERLDPDPEICQAASAGRIEIRHCRPDARRAAPAAGLCTTDLYAPGNRLSTTGGDTRPGQQRR